jgi:hypothetical protein
VQGETLFVRVAVVARTDPPRFRISVPSSLARVLLAATKVSLVTRRDSPLSFVSVVERLTGLPLTMEAAFRVAVDLREQRAKEILARFGGSGIHVDGASEVRK